MCGTVSRNPSLNSKPPTDLQSLVFVSVGASQLVDIVGRRFLFLTSTAGMLASMIIVTGLSAGYAEHLKNAIGTAVIPFLFIFYGFYDIAWTPLGFL